MCVKGPESWSDTPFLQQWRVRYLLVVDTARNVVLVDADNDIRMPIGAPLTSDQQSGVMTAVWSAVGQWTAWSVDSASPDGVREVRLHDEESDQAGVLVEAVSAFYMCPSPCGRWLSHLSPGPLGLELAVSEIATRTMHIVERGQPLFWSWSPDSSQLAVHVENRVIVANNDGSSPRLLTAEAGPFVTPWWLPGRSVVYALGDRIVTAGPDNVVTTLVDGASTGRFSLDPERRRLAYVCDNGKDTKLVVLDLVSMTSNDVTSAPIASFFWSPDGNRLAILTTTGDGHLQWLVAEESDRRRLAPFRPTRRWAQTVVSFFEQYEQSHTPWSTDSSALVAPALDDLGRSGALVQPVEANAESTWLADAELAWWA